MDNKLVIINRTLFGYEIIYILLVRIIIILPYNSLFFKKNILNYI